MAADSSQPSSSESLTTLLQRQGAQYISAQRPGNAAAAIDWVSWLLLDKCGAGLVVVDEDARLRFCNGAAREEQGLRTAHLGAALSAEDDAAGGIGERAVSARQRVAQTDDGLSWLLRVAQLRGPPALTNRQHHEPHTARALGDRGADHRDRNGATESATRTAQLASLGTPAAGIAHEINNPLNAIMMNAELGLMALEGEPDAARVRRALDPIIEDVQRCAGLTSSVLKLSRKGSSAKAPADLNEIVRAARRLVDAKLQMRDATIELALADVPRLPLDTQGMESAAVNLLSNAATSTERGVSIKVESWREQDEIVLRVADTGEGMNENVLEHIFDAFFTTAQPARGSQADRAGVRVLTAAVYGARRRTGR